MLLVFKKSGGISPVLGVACWLYGLKIDDMS